MVTDPSGGRWSGTPQPLARCSQSSPGIRCPRASGRRWRTTPQPPRTSRPPVPRRVGRRASGRSDEEYVAGLMDAWSRFTAAERAEACREYLADPEAAIAGLQRGLPRGFPAEGYPSSSASSAADRCPQRTVAALRCHRATCWRASSTERTSSAPTRSTARQRGVGPTRVSRAPGEPGSRARGRRRVRVGRSAVARGVPQLVRGRP
jgi:hypothetical protein